MKIYFDATFGEHIIDSLRGLFRFHQDPKPRLLHIYDRFERDVKDEEWISEISGKDSIVISCDWGRGKGVRLPVVCKLKKITLILISPSLHNAKQFHKVRAVMYVWPDIIKAFKAPAGTCFQITSIGVNYERFRFEERKEG